ncbi:hypothetical protein [Butyrivibrio sp. AE2032]|uniref:hypothetical protein n=1 Tax=Butyrivibrio sp. AE2032 TaxID=1458463 RepID=UPI0005579B5F|nr:hypothetical protein [Butyrivibrio sp. AE2032]
MSKAVKVIMTVTGIVALVAIAIVVFTVPYVNTTAKVVNSAHYASIEAEGLMDSDYHTPELSGTVNESLTLSFFAGGEEYTVNCHISAPYANNYGLHNPGSYVEIVYNPFFPDKSVKVI